MTKFKILKGFVAIGKSLGVRPTVLTFTSRYRKISRRLPSCRYFKNQRDQKCLFIYKYKLFFQNTQYFKLFVDVNVKIFGARTSIDVITPHRLYSQVWLILNSFGSILLHFTEKKLFKLISKLKTIFSVNCRD